MEIATREIGQLAVVVEPANLVFGLRGPEDEFYLANAVTGNTRDVTACELLFDTFCVVTPGEWLMKEDT